MFLTDLTENELQIVIDKLIEKYVKEYMRNPLNVQNVSKLRREYKEEQRKDSCTTSKILLLKNLLLKTG